MILFVSHINGAVRSQRNSPGLVESSGRPRAICKSLGTACNSNHGGVDNLPDTVICCVRHKVEVMILHGDAGGIRQGGGTAVPYYRADNASRDHPDTVVSKIGNIHRAGL